MIKFGLKVVILAAVFLALTKWDVQFAGTDVLPGLRVEPNAEGPLGEFGTYLWIALIFGVVNAIVGPILRLFGFPFVVLTLGLFLLVINAAVLGITAAVTDRLSIDGFVTAVIGGLILAVAGWLADQLLDR